MKENELADAFGNACEKLTAGLIVFNCKQMN
jgi:hypothetical protein